MSKTMQLNYKAVGKLQPSLKAFNSYCFLSFSFLRIRDWILLEITRILLKSYFYKLVVDNKIILENHCLQIYYF